MRYKNSMGTVFQHSPKEMMDEADMVRDAVGGWSEGWTGILARGSLHGCGDLLQEFSDNSREIEFSVYLYTVVCPPVYVPTD